MENISGISKVLTQEGFRVEGILRDEKLPIGLAQYSIRLAEGLYRNLMIVPGRFTEFEGGLINGSGIWVPKDPCHVVFARPEPNDPFFDDEIEKVLQFNAVEKSSRVEGQYIHCSLSALELKNRFPKFYSV